MVFIHTFLFQSLTINNYILVVSVRYECNLFLKQNELQGFSFLSLDSSENDVMWVVPLTFKF